MGYVSLRNESVCLTSRYFLSGMGFRFSVILHRTHEYIIFVLDQSEMLKDRQGMERISPYATESDTIPILSGGNQGGRPRGYVSLPDANLRSTVV